MGRRVRLPKVDPQSGLSENGPIAALAVIEFKYCHSWQKGSFAMSLNSPAFIINGMTLFFLNALGL